MDANCQLLLRGKKKHEIESFKPSSESHFQVQKTLDRRTAPAEKSPSLEKHLDFRIRPFEGSSLHIETEYTFRERKAGESYLQIR